MALGQPISRTIVMKFRIYHLAASRSPFSWGKGIGELCYYGQDSAFHHKEAASK